MRSRSWPERPTKGLPIAVLVGARRLADEHHAARGIAVGEGEVLGAELQGAALEARRASPRARRALRRFAARSRARASAASAGEAGGRRERPPAGAASAMGRQRARLAPAPAALPRRSGRAAPRRGRDRRPPRHRNRAALRGRRDPRRGRSSSRCRRSVTGRTIVARRAADAGRCCDDDAQRCADRRNVPDDVSARRGLLP